jgi:hypothetical protein
MVPRHFFTAAICATLLAWSGPSIADQYRPGEFLSLDLSKAVLSPKPLGPATQFAPFPIEAGSDSDGSAPQARVETKAARCAGLRYADSGLAVPVGRHLQLVAAGAGAITHDRVRPATAAEP